MRSRTPLLIGISGGLAFFANALVDNSHAWPLVWPAIAGAAAVALRNRDETKTYATNIGQAGMTGLVAGLIFIVGTIAALSMMGAFQASIASGLLIAAALGVAAAMLFGTLAHIWVARRTPA